MNPSAPLPDLSRLCIHTITTKPWAIETSAEKFAKAGVKGITVWRDTLAGRDIQKTGQLIRDQGLSIVSLCRGGFFPAATAADRAKALDDNRKAIEEAHALGAPLIVLVCGAVPGQSLVESRKQIVDGIAALLPECKGATHSEAVSHCAECCFGSGYELHGPEDQVILDAAIALAALAALPAPEGLADELRGVAHPCDGGRIQSAH